MTTKQELLDQIKVLEDKVNKLETPKPEEKTGVIYDKPEYGEPVYTLGQEGVVEEDTYSRAWNPELLQGNLFYDRPSAELEAKRRAIRHRISKFCHDAWEADGRKLDFGNLNQIRFFLEWNSYASKLNCSPDSYTKSAEFYLPSMYKPDGLYEQFTNAELKLALTGSE